MSTPSSAKNLGLTSLSVANDAQIKGDLVVSGTTTATVTPPSYNHVYAVSNGISDAVNNGSYEVGTFASPTIVGAALTSTDSGTAFTVGEAGIYAITAEINVVSTDTLTHWTTSIHHGSSVVASGNIVAQNKTEFTTGNLNKGICSITKYLAAGQKIYFTGNFVGAGLSVNGATITVNIAKVQ